MGNHKQKLQAIYSLWYWQCIHKIWLKKNKYRELESFHRQIDKVNVWRFDTQAYLGSTRTAVIEKYNFLTLYLFLNPHKHIQIYHSKHWTQFRIKKPMKNVTSVYFETICSRETSHANRKLKIKSTTQLKMMMIYSAGIKPFCKVSLSHDNIHGINYKDVFTSFRSTEPLDRLYRS